MLENLAFALGLAEKPKPCFTPKQAQIEALILENELLKQDIIALKHSMKYMILEAEVRDFKMQQIERAMRF